MEGGGGVLSIEGVLYLYNDMAMFPIDILTTLEVSNKGSNTFIIHQDSNEHMFTNCLALRCTGEINIAVFTKHGIMLWPPPYILTCRI